MSARPGEWHLLGEASDPVPGSSWEIRSEGLHHSQVASDIQTQVQALRNLADDGVSKGEYLDSIRENCEDTAEDLARAYERFETVGSQLQSWAEDVETARSETWSALQLAEDADATLRANPEPDLPGFGAPPLTPEEQSQVDQTNARRDGAESLLSSARNRFESAMSTYDGRAEAMAKAIRDASDDDMKDSTWDKVKNWVSENAGWLKAVAEVIGWIVTIVAIVALFCTPAGWVMLLVAAVALVGVGIRALLAASGEGSWAEFAIDLVGVLTLGTGKIATKVAQSGRSATLAAIGRFTGSQARATKVTALVTQFKNAPLLKKPGVWLFQTNPAMRWLAGRAAYRQTYLSWVNRSLPDVTPWQLLRGGGDDVAAAMRRELAELTTQFPQFVSRSYGVGSRVAAGAAGTGWVVDLSDKGLGLGADWYNDFKESTWRHEPGGHLG